jgi:hypothetical protein
VSGRLRHSERPVHSGIIDHSQYLINFKRNDLPAFASIHPEVRIMTDQERMRLDARIAHYRFLQREVTDSLAACLLDSVIVELES